MKPLLLLVSLVACFTLAFAEQKTGTVQYYRSAIIVPGFPRPKDPLAPGECDAIKQGLQRPYAYVEAYYSEDGLLEKLQKVYKGKVLWKYEFMYAGKELIRIMEYDSKGKPSLYYDYRQKGGN